MPSPVPRMLLLHVVIVVVFEFIAVCMLQDPDEGAIYSGELYTNPNDFLPKVNVRPRKLYLEPIITLPGRASFL